MSYEGYDEFICPNGHYWIVDASISLFGSNEEKREASSCPYCENAAMYSCDVDETNGYEIGNPYTMPGPKTEVGVTYLEQSDKDGNKYFTKLLKFSPDLESGRWRKI